MLYLPPSSSKSETKTATRALLVADRAGGRTVIRRQHVGYPLHVTRPFHLDRNRADLATLYLQSASGGLYAGDNITLDLTIEADAALHLTTQASTVVHDGRGLGSAQNQTIRVHSGGFGAVISDPFILFPNAHLSIATSATVAEDAVLILADGFAVHDPAQRNTCFDRFITTTRIQRPDGSLLISDRGKLAGTELAGSFGPLGGHLAAATMLVMAPPQRCADVAEMEMAAHRCGCLAGTSFAPNKAGLAMRILAADGGTLTRGIEAAFHVAAKAALGVDLARRRK